MRGRPAENTEIKKKFIRKYDDSIWHYNLDKYPNGPYLVEIIDPKFDKVERLGFSAISFKAHSSTSCLKP